MNTVYLEAPRRIDPPYVDAPETDQQEVIEVALGRRLRDGLGRDRDELFCDTPMGLVFQDIFETPDAEAAMWDFFDLHWGDVPVEVREIIEGRAEAAARQEPIWSRT